MKKFWLIFLLCLPYAASADWYDIGALRNSGVEVKKNSTYSITDFSAGAYTYPPANRIPDNAASFISNFFTDIHPLGDERNGNIQRDSTVLGATAAVTGLWTFVDTSQNEWIISFSSKTFYKNLYGQTPTAFGLSPTVTTIPHAALSNGKIWFVNGTDNLWWFDGTTTGTVAGAPLGTLIMPWRTRLVIAGIGGATHTAVRFSADGDGTSWTLGPLATDPFQMTVTGTNDGQGINCLYGTYHDVLIIGRKFDLWGVSGFDQPTAEMRQISSEVGCIQNDSMQEFDGGLNFLSARGLENMNGSSIQLISDPIRDIIDPVIKNTANGRFITQTTQVDFAPGTKDNVYIDTFTFSGDVRLLWPDTFDVDRTQAQYGNVWTSYTGGGSAGAVSISGGQLVITNNGGTSGLFGITAPNFPIVQFQQGTTFHIKIVGSQGSDATNKNQFELVLSSMNISGTQTLNPDQLGSRWYYQFSFQDNSSSNLSLIAGANDKGDSVFPASISTTFPNTFDLWLGTNTFCYTMNSVAHCGAHTWPNRPIYAYLMTANTTGGPNKITLDDFDVAPETATFTSSIISVGNSISAWSNFSVNADIQSGTMNLQFGSTNTASVGSISNFTALNNNTIPTVATGSYCAYKATFIKKVINDGTAFHDATVNWLEGSSPPNKSFVWDKRYWLSITTTTSTGTMLDLIVVYQRNHTFTFLQGMKAASFTRWKDHLYWGDSTGTTGLVNQYDTGNSDNGTAITSSIKTKSYDFGYVANDKDLWKCYVGYDGSPNFFGNFALNYDIERSGSAYSLGTAAMNEGTGQISAKFPFPLSTSPTQGREIQYTLTKSGTGDRLKLYDIRTVFSLKEPK